MQKAVLLSLCAFALGGCFEKSREEKTAVAAVHSVTPAARPILVDGSTTVEPLTRGIVDLYASQLVSDVKVEASGTGGGFKKFCRKGTHINEASRPISAAEQRLCDEQGVKFVEVPVAFDAVAVVVPKGNEFLKGVKKSELARIWSSNSKDSVELWSELAPQYPREKIELFGHGLENGTFDFFTEAVLGGAERIRGDYHASTKPALIAEGISRSKSALGFMSFAHYLKHEKGLRTVPVDDENEENGKGAFTPSLATIADGTYQPLSRPLFLYVSTAELSRPEVVAFIDFYLRSARLVAPDVGYAPLPKHLFVLAKKRLDERKTGTIFTGGEAGVGVTIEELLSVETISIGATPSVIERRPSGPVDAK